MEIKLHWMKDRRKSRQNNDDCNEHKVNRRYSVFLFLVKTKTDIWLKHLTAYRGEELSRKSKMSKDMVR